MQMLLKSTLLVGTATFLCLGTAFADDLSLTIYGDGRALIEDNRTLEFSSGEQVLQLPGVSSSIVAPSVTLNAAGMTIIEQNFDFDLLSPSKLMEKAVGQYVNIIRTNPATGIETTQRAKVLSVNNGVVIQIGNEIEVLRDDNIPTRVVFPKVPENLRAKPTLSVRVDSDRAGNRPAKLTYLSGGLNWAADYVAVFNEADKDMSLQGWATVNNTTLTSFEDAELSVVAGQVGNANNNRYNQYNRNNNQRRGGTEAGSVERIGDNYIYPLPGKTTLASQQKKQIAFVDADAIRAEKRYEYYAYGFQTQSNPISVDSRIAFSNSKAGGLGEALPKGTVRVYMKDAQGRAQFVGEDAIGHISGGSDISLKIGEAFDISVQPTVVKQNNVNRKIVETEMKYELRNAKKEPVFVSIYQSQPGWYFKYDVLDESDESTLKDAETRVWRLKVPAEGSKDLTFKIRRSWL